ncbi:hypothetical protein PPTG_22502 [Phytophthora nicotianae INRA-310]|uniref:Uncharacterized protein n=1 Tax=Phytophthora nicotianae (strain INRA-310) TaxID=761204 RepID=W2QI46_PHYN3|nr:hypothetical protein PPTG_22502 [Phytophthora nicotianae INRA-310]ETN12561.1 hypothetical protein PPTG_22502 [Phytophthora nicotianae INRA-310]
MTVDVTCPDVHTVWHAYGAAEANATPSSRTLHSSTDRKKTNLERGGMNASDLSPLVGTKACSMISYATIV